MTVRDVYANHEWTTVCTKNDGIYSTRLGADITEFLDKEVKHIYVCCVDNEAIVTVDA